MQRRNYCVTQHKNRLRKRVSIDFTIVAASERIDLQISLSDMAVSRFMFATFIFCLVFNVALSDSEKEVEDENKASFGDAVGESMKGMNNWFKGMAEGVKDKAEDGVDALKSFSAVAKDVSEDGMDKAKGWAEGLGDSFSKAKEKVSETGEKMKEVLGDAMINTKEEFESAASKMTNYAKDATGSMFKLLG